ncbi:MAG: hypothetical protein HEQ40_16045 [Lacibacter sp.]|jgi:hypothetical protein
MKNTIVLVAILFLNTALGQTKKYFDNFELDSTCTVIGMGPYLMQNVDKYERFEFIISGRKNLDALKSDWTIGNKVSPIIQRNLFSIYVIKDKRVINAGVVNPESSNLKWGDGWYSFDTNYLAVLGKKYHLNYFIEEKSVPNITEYEKLYNSLRENPSLLYIIKPSFGFEGKFTITIKYSKELNSPSAAINYLKTKFKSIQTSVEPGLVYILDDFNMQNNTSLMRITISSGYELYQKLDKKSYVISNWEPILYKCKLFWRK